MGDIERKDKKMKRGYLFALAVLLLMAGAFSSFQERGFVFAEDEECVTSSWTDDELVRNEYRCTSNDCGADILHREYRRTRSCWSDSCGGGGCSPWSYYYTSPSLDKDLDDWLRCDPGQTDWQTSYPNYNCQGNCLEAPTNPRYDGGASNVNLDLPVEMSWTNVPGFGNMAEKGPLSYNIDIDNTNTEPGSAGFFVFEDDYSGTGSFPVFSSLPDLDLSRGSPIDGQFVTVNGKYRFIRPTPNSIRTITSCFGNRWRHWDIPPKWGFHNGIDVGHSGRLECVRRGVRFGANVCLEVQPTTGNTWISLYAAAPGTITFVGDGRGAGNMVTIDHSAYSFDLLSDTSKKETRYMHLNSFSGSDQYGGIRSGDRVTPSGQIWGVRQVGIDPETEEPIYQNVQIRNDTIIGRMGSTGVSTGAHLHFEIKINGQAVDPLSLITIPDQSPWIGTVPCLAGGSSALRSTNILATVPGDERPYDERLEEYSSAMPPFSYIEQGNPFSANLKGNRFLAENCLLKPSDSYEWSVQACCNWDGTNCGPTASWSMSTSDKAEQLRQGTEAGTSSDPEIIYRLGDANLRWCEMRFEETVTIGGEEQTVFLPPDRYEVVVEQNVPFLLFWTRYETHPLVQAMGGSIFRIASPPARTPPTHVRNDDFLLFTKSDYAEYRWKVRACIGEDDDARCNDYTPDRYIKVSDEVVIDRPNLLSPSDDPQGNNEIAWPIDFRWSASLGANSYIFELYDGNEPIIQNEIVESVPDETGRITRIHSISLPREDVDLNLDTLYRWRVKSCWDTRAQLCENEWSERHFKTTGRPPTLENPGPDAQNVLIPLQLSWEQVPGARSYLLDFNGRETVVTNNRGNIGYPVLEQDTLYTWSVRTCNDVRGEVCGERSETRLFRTIALEPPQNLLPVSADYFSDQHNRINLSWDEVLGANYYEVSISCDGAVVFSDATSETAMGVPLSCVGDNHWTVRACIDENCEDTGESSEGHFILHEGRMTGTGFVPCGLSYNNPDTPWNEREPCRFSHLFIMIKIILDFLFWNLMPLVLVVMVVVSGLIFYLSLGDPNVIVRIKAIWSSVGKGLLIMFFGWTAISIIMAIMGYTGIFGPWWQISF